MTKEEFNILADLGVYVVKMAGIVCVVNLTTLFIKGLKYKESEL